MRILPKADNAGKSAKPESAMRFGQATGVFERTMTLPLKLFQELLVLSLQGLRTWQSFWLPRLLGH